MSMIVPILSLIFVITFVTCIVIKSIKESKLEKVKNKEKEEKLNSVIPGTILYKEDISGNPFADECNSSIKVIDVKRNSKGEIWIKYAYEDIIRPGLYFEKTASYSKLEDRLIIYPIIKLPKQQ